MSPLFGLVPLQHLLMVEKLGQVCFTGKDDTGGQRVPYERNFLPPDSGVQPINQ